MKKFEYPRKAKGGAVHGGSDKQKVTFFIILLKKKIGD